MPRWLWDELNPNPSGMALWNRLCDVCGAIGRYRQADVTVPEEWLDEAEHWL